MTADHSSDTRFRKGVSGNPRGRPKKVRAAAEPSALDFLLAQTVTITQNGEERSVALAEALQHRLYKDALAGKRSAQREILRMIVAREKAIADQNPTDWNSGPLTFTGDPENADLALLALGIADHDGRWVDLDLDPIGVNRLLLKTWAVQAALSRPGARNYDDRAVSEIERCTRDPKTLRWPRSHKP